MNEAGEALNALGLGAVRLAYWPADELVPRDRFTFWITASAHQRDIVGCGDTPQAALDDALGKLSRKAA